MSAMIHQPDEIRYRAMAHSHFIGWVLLTSMMMFSMPSPAAEIESAIARGGQLYDNWTKVISASKPKTPHPAYPEKGQYRGKSGADWRCKECHGWDYIGSRGAYGKGKHFTGIKGVERHAGAGIEQIAMVLTDKNHSFDMLSERDVRDLSLFIDMGQVDMDQYIDRETRQVMGDKEKGEPIYNTVCAKCHGLDGTSDEDGKPLAADGEPLGRVATENPWETLHKIRNGQPGERMPALRAFDMQISLDLLAYLQTLPVEVLAEK